MNPKILVATAYAFEVAADDIGAAAVGRGRETSPGLVETDLSSVFPQVVNEAFAAELYLKTLLLVTANAHPRGHNLLALFDALPLSVQQGLESALRSGGESELSFRDHLELGALAFEVFRYPHEWPHFGPLERVNYPGPHLGKYFREVIVQFDRELDPTLIRTWSIDP